MKYCLFLLSIILVSLSVSASPVKEINAGESVNWQALTSGGESSARDLRVVSSFGQTVVGVTSSASNQVIHGFLQNFNFADYSCCIGFTGNVNCSGLENPDISDITRLIDFLYLTQAALCCPQESDTDGSGQPFDIPGGDPDISDVMRLIDYLYLSKTPLSNCP
ncbi:MAG: hypothetical protein ACOYVF_14410 [Candidatus Zixiibacteriota bacterium]